MQKLDTNYSVETPEAIDLNAQLAGPVPRILAYAIDIGIRTLVTTVLFVILAVAGEAGFGLYLVITFLLEWFYPVLFEVLRRGQTPGKKYLGIAVVNDDLTPVTWSTSIIRNLLRAADFLPFAYLFGVIAMCSSRHFQRLGDMAAGSVVIHRPTVKAWNLQLPKVTSQPPPFSLSLEDQVAFTGFSQRSEQLSADRREELADILEDITHKQGAPAVAYVQGVGNWLLGDRK